MDLPKFTVFLAVILVALLSGTPGRAQSLTVGGKNFTEQLLMAEMTGQLLKAKGYAVWVKAGFATPGLRREQEAGLIDVYWEYTGTSLLTFNNVTEPFEPEEAYTRVRELDAKKGLIWLTPSRVNNTYALAMRRADAAAKGITSISDLAILIRQGATFRFACNTEFYIRPDGLLPLQRAYRFAFATEQVIRAETGAIYGLLRDDRSIDLGLVFSTDGRVSAYDLLLLEDDRKFLPSYLLTPVVHQRALKQHPDLATHLNALSAKLDNNTISSLNAMIDLQNQSVEEVALSFLKASGLL